MHGTAEHPGVSDVPFWGGVWSESVAVLRGRFQSFSHVALGWQMGSTTPVMSVSDRRMSMLLQPWHLLVVAMAGILNREQAAVVEYLRVENEVLREQLKSKGGRL